MKAKTLTLKDLIRLLRSIDTPQSWGGASVLNDWIHRLKYEGDENCYYKINGYIWSLYSISIIDEFERNALIDELIIL